MASPSGAASRAGASRTNAASRPTNRALFIVAGMAGILGAPRHGPARVGRLTGGRILMAVPMRRPRAAG